VIEMVAAAGAILLLDQWTKRAVRPIASVDLPSTTYIPRIRHLENANRIYRNPSARVAMVFVWLGAVASGIALRESGMWFQHNTSLTGLGFALGGAAGNLIDIWRHQSVTDFIDLGWWPVFNLADVGIVGGLLLAFWP
jgi:signal peptidase II